MFRLLLLPAVGAVAAADAPVVNVPGQGVALGVYDPICDGVEIFFGLPYARPPVGALRWREPQPLAAWPNATAAHPFNATAFGARCMQDAAIPTLVPMAMSEDCLFLNVHAPKGAAAAAAAGAPASRPVMLWIHGGSYTTGESNDYTGDTLVAASQGTTCALPSSAAPASPSAPERPAAAADSSVVVVTINYRLNAFGFLGSRHLAAEEGAAGTGNYGIADQVLSRDLLL